VGRAGDEEVDMVLTHVALEDLDLQLRADVSHDLPQTDGYVRPQQLLAIFRDPHEVILQVISRMGRPSVVVHVANVLKWSPEAVGSRKVS
jgi:hypothetical protein